MSLRWLIGLSSGTTVEGIDAALLEAQGIGLDMRPRLIHYLHQPHPRELRDLLVRVSCSQSTTLKQVALLHRLLGETFFLAARKVADEASFSLQNVQCIGCPGHTIWHEPENRYPSTLPLGMTAVMAERTGVTTISDFRSRDLVLEGQGLPLTALVDFLLFSKRGENRLLVNLGGVASLVWLPACCESREILGFQSSPCNVILNGLMHRLTGGKETFDAWGKHAVQGRCMEELLNRWLSHPLLSRKPPKGVPLQSFGEEFINQTLEQAKLRRWSLHDVLCTATHFVARGITDAIKQFLPGIPDRIILSGGGVHNGLLWRLLEQNLSGTNLESIERQGIPPRARKAVGFGCLGGLTLDCFPTNLSSVTGATGARLLGSITPGSSYNWAKCVAWMTEQTGALVAA